MSRRADHPWGRWIRASEAHFYASAGDRRYFDQHFKPKLTQIHLGKQGRAYIRAEIDAIGESIENELRSQAGPQGRPVDELPAGGQVPLPPPMGVMKQSNERTRETRRSAKRKPSAGTAQEPNSRRDATRSSSKRYADRVLEKLTAELQRTPSHAPAALKPAPTGSRSQGVSRRAPRPPAKS